LGGNIETDVTTRKKKKQRCAMRRSVEVYNSEQEGERATPEEEKQPSNLLGKVLAHH
jgi:hypothetical protein